MGKEVGGMKHLAETPGLLLANRGFDMQKRRSNKGEGCVVIRVAGHVLLLGRPLGTPCLGLPLKHNPLYHPMNNSLGPRKSETPGYPRRLHGLSPAPQTPPHKTFFLLLLPLSFQFLLLSLSLFRTNEAIHPPIRNHQMVPCL